MSDNEKDQNTEEFNKQLLKHTAVTFSMEGVSNDLKYFIQKKVNHNKTNLIYLTQLMDLALSSESEDIGDFVTKEGSPLIDLLIHVCSEIKQTDVILNKTLEAVLKRDSLLNDTKGE